MRYDHPHAPTLHPQGYRGSTDTNEKKNAKRSTARGLMRCPGINGVLPRTSGCPRLKRQLLIIPDPASGEGGQEYVRIFGPAAYR